jgi:hypothetical protein
MSYESRFLSRKWLSYFMGNINRRLYMQRIFLLVPSRHDFVIHHFDLSRCLA